MHVLALADAASMVYTLHSRTLRAWFIPSVVGKARALAVATSSWHSTQLPVTTGIPKN
eukprot:NODE_29339_length_449_cov_1.093168.p6 GENE.NODE_29339_length_449_cov_1.093168~~NODE_29339_length_449_cov_1.093168.p6  ORF type:complete len:58 (-),score=8.08 NODE_29339_length_449_cov_1.093168:137-310(-)